MNYTRNQQPIGEQKMNNTEPCYYGKKYDMNEQRKMPQPPYGEQPSAYGSALGGADVVRQPALDDLRNLMQSIDALSEYISRLNEKLSPVLAGPMPVQENNPPRAPWGSSQLSRMVHETWLKVDALSTQVIVLTDRVEV